MEAALLTGRAEYVEEIRRFSEHPQYRSAFRIGTVEIAAGADPPSLALTLDAETRLRTVARDGIEIATAGGERRFLVEPGAVDQDFPAYDVALPFFDALAASIAAVTGEAPTVLYASHAPGTDWAYDRDHRATARVSVGSSRRRITLQFGAEPRPWSGHVLAGEGPADLVWRRGETTPAEFAGCRWWRACEARGHTAIDKAALGVRDKPQLVVVNGFLGSGKTSFLQRFVEYQVQRSRFVAVIQNEIGAVGLDGKLLESQYAVKELDEGCVCCSLLGNLRRGTAAVLADFQPDYVVLETTGAANPLNLLGEITTLEDQVTPGLTITLVDSATITGVTDEYALAEDQIRAADVAVLNKIDLVDPPTLAAVRALVSRLNPLARVFETLHGDVNLSELLSVGLPAHPKSDYDRSHPDHADAQLAPVKIALATTVEREEFVAALRLIPHEVFRAKGVARFTGDESPTLVQYVAGRYELTPFRQSSFEDLPRPDRPRPRCYRAGGIVRIARRAAHGSSRDTGTSRRTSSRRLLSTCQTTSCSALEELHLTNVTEKVLDEAVRATTSFKTGKLSLCCGDCTWAVVQLATLRRLQRPPPSVRRAMAEA